MTKSPLAPRFQEAIDEAAMRLGDTGSDDYLAGWRRGDWTAAEGSTAEVADHVVAAPRGRVAGRRGSRPTSTPSARGPA